MTATDRVTGACVEIDPAAVQQFFDRRGEGASAAHPLTSVLYQDHDPELARARDAHEKSVAMPKLRLSAANSVLDIGCGIGRWAEPVCETGASYLGVDFSEPLLDIARRTAPAAASFARHSMTDLDPVTLRGRFDRIVMAGVAIYVNDDDLERSLDAAAACADDHCVVYLREPTAVAERLTLNEFWSEDLDSRYSAIYRTRDEILDVLAGTLLAEGFSLVEDRELYPARLNNRAETVQRFYILERP